MCLVAKRGVTLKFVKLFDKFLVKNLGPDARKGLRTCDVVHGINLVYNQEPLPYSIRGITCSTGENFVDFLRAGDLPENIRDVLQGHDVNTLIGDANYFISHAWKMPWWQLVEILTDYAAKCQIADEDFCVWLDIFAINQHSGYSEFWFHETAKATCEQELKQVAEVLRFVGCLIFCFDDNWHEPLAISRAWCWHESITCHSLGKPVHLGITRKAKTELTRALKYFEDTKNYPVTEHAQQLMELFGKLNAEKSRAQMKDDDEYIHALLVLKGGENYAGVNRSMKWVVATLLLELAKDIDLEEGTSYSPRKTGLLRYIWENHFTNGIESAVLRLKLARISSMRDSIEDARQYCNDAIEILQSEVSTLRELNDDRIRIWYYLAEAELTYGRSLCDTFRFENLHPALKHLNTAKRTLQRVLSLSKKGEISFSFMLITECEILMTRVQYTIARTVAVMFSFRNPTEGDRKLIELGMTNVDEALAREKFTDPSQRGSSYVMRSKLMDFRDILDERVDDPIAARESFNCIQRGIELQCQRERDVRSTMSTISLAFHYQFRRKYDKALEALEDANEGDNGVLIGTLTNRFPPMRLLYWGNLRLTILEDHAPLNPQVRIEKIEHTMRTLHQYFDWLHVNHSQKYKNEEEVQTLLAKVKNFFQQNPHLDMI